MLDAARNLAELDHLTALSSGGLRHERENRGDPTTSRLPRITGISCDTGSENLHLTQDQQVKLAWIAKTDPRLHRAYLLKEGLRVIRRNLRRCGCKRRPESSDFVPIGKMQITPLLESRVVAGYQGDGDCA